MSVGKASIRRAVGAENKPTEAAPVTEKVTEAAPSPKASAKASASKAPAKKPAAKAAVKTPAKAPAKAPVKASVKKTPAAPVKKAEPKAGSSAVSVTEDLPYYLL